MTCLMCRRPPALVQKMLDLAALTPADYLIDLGCGDGRIAIAAAGRGARALGVDIDPLRIREAVLAAQLAGVETRALFRRQDLFRTPIFEANVIALYLLPRINLALRPRLLTELRPGSRVVSHSLHDGRLAAGRRRRARWPPPLSVDRAGRRRRDLGNDRGRRRGADSRARAALSDVTRYAHRRRPGCARYREARYAGPRSAHRRGTRLARHDRPTPGSRARAGAPGESARRPRQERAAPDRIDRPRTGPGRRAACCGR